MRTYLVTVVRHGEVEQRKGMGRNSREALRSAFPRVMSLQKFSKRISPEEFVIEVLRAISEPSLLLVPLGGGDGVMIECHDDVIAYVFPFLPLFPLALFVPDPQDARVAFLSEGAIIVLRPFHDEKMRAVPLSGLRKEVTEG